MQLGENTPSHGRICLELPWEGYMFLVTPLHYSIILFDRNWFTQEYDATKCTFARFGQYTAVKFCRVKVIICWWQHEDLPFYRRFRVRWCKDAVSWGEDAYWTEIKMLTVTVPRLAYSYPRPVHLVHDCWQVDTFKTPIGRNMCISRYETTIYNLYVSISWLFQS